MGSNAKQARRNSRQPDPAILLGLPRFRQLGEIHGNVHSYVDIVGVTGSIPVAPTIHKSGPRIACQQSPGQAAGTLLPDTARSGEVDAPRAILAELKRP